MLGCRPLADIPGGPASLENLRKIDALTTELQADPAVASVLSPTAVLPTGERIQIVSPPATRRHFALSIRRHRLLDVPLTAYEREAKGAKAGRNPSRSRRSNHCSLRRP